MRERSNRALELIREGKLDEAYSEAVAACGENPGDYHSWYALAHVHRWAERDVEALKAFERAATLAPQEGSVLLALAIAKQRLRDFAGAIEVLRRALDADSDYVPAYNTLGMTQKLMGDPESAAYNYDAGAKAIVRSWARTLRNMEGAQRLPNVRTRHDLWHEYATFGAMWLAARDGIGQVAFPTGALAEDDGRTQRFRGWYWQDSVGDTGEKWRLFLPNFFNAAAHHLHDDGTYPHLMANRSTVLEMLGRLDEARKHAEEAQDFMS